MGIANLSKTPACFVKFWMLVTGGRRRSGRGLRDTGCSENIASFQLNILIDGRWQSKDLDRGRSSDMAQQIIRGM